MVKDLLEATANEMFALNFSRNLLTTHSILTQSHLLEIERFALSKIGHFLDIKLPCIKFLVYLIWIFARILSACVFLAR